MLFRYRDLVDDGDLRSVGVYTSQSPGGINYWYKGGFYTNLRPVTFNAAYTPANLSGEYASPGSKFPSETNASSYGAQAWNRFKPGKSSAQLGVFLGEIRDVPRMLKTTASIFNKSWRSLGGSTRPPSKELANHWLNTQFGWLPFLNDLRKFYKTYRILDDRLARFKRENGRWVRKGGSVVDDEGPVSHISGSSTNTAHQPILATPIYRPGPTGSHSIDVKKTSNVWFVASFRYWVPWETMETPEWKARAVAELFGVFPNPAILWELTPFSWLVDWVANVGDVISNITPGLADNLVARYCFIMKHVSVQGTVTSWCNLKDATLHDSWSYTMEWKTRNAGSRFGFGLTESDFSLRQWSILAALGIQRS